MAEGTRQITTTQYLDIIKNGVLDEITKNESALPPGFRKERFALNAQAAIQSLLKDDYAKKKIKDIDVRTIPPVLAKAAYLGLDYMNGECYPIPYKGELKFQTDYKGEIKICKRFNKHVKNIYAKLVRNGDRFQERIINGEPQIEFEPVPFGDFNKENIKGAFAVVVYDNGSMAYEAMGVDEIEYIRKTYSMAPDSPAWKKSYGEMCKKTVLRRLCKTIDLDFDDMVQQQAFNEGGDSVFNNKPEGVEPENIAPVDIFADAEVHPVEDVESRPVDEGEQEVLPFN